MVLAIYVSLLCFIYFFQKAENDRLKKKRVTQNYFTQSDIIFLLLLKIGSVVPVDQQINLVSPKQVVIIISTLISTMILILRFTKNKREYRSKSLYRDILSFSKYAKFSEKLTFLTPLYARVTCT